MRVYVLIVREPTRVRSYAFANKALAMASIEVTYSHCHPPVIRENDQEEVKVWEHGKPGRPVIEGYWEAPREILTRVEHL